MRLFVLMNSAIGSINDRIFLLTNRQTVLTWVRLKILCSLSMYFIYCVACYIHFLQETKIQNKMLVFDHAILNNTHKCYNVLENEMTFRLTPIRISLHIRILDEWLCGAYCISIRGRSRVVSWKGQRPKLIENGLIFQDFGQFQREAAPQCSLLDPPLSISIQSCYRTSEYICCQHLLT